MTRSSGAMPGARGRGGPRRIARARPRRPSIATRRWTWLTVRCDGTRPTGCQPKRSGRRPLEAGPAGDGFRGATWIRFSTAGQISIPAQRAPPMMSIRWKAFIPRSTMGFTLIPVRWAILRQTGMGFTIWQGTVGGLGGICTMSIGMAMRELSWATLAARYLHPEDSPSGWCAAVRGTAARAARGVRVASPSTPPLAAASSVSGVFWRAVPLRKWLRFTSLFFYLFRFSGPREGSGDPDDDFPLPHWS